MNLGLERFGVGDGVGLAEGVIEGVGDGDEVGDGVGEGDGVRETEGTGAATSFELLTQTNFLPFFTQRNSFPDLTATFPARGQVAPALTAPIAGSEESMVDVNRKRRKNR